MLANICRHPGCQELVSSQEKYCCKHKTVKQPLPSKKPFENAKRNNSFYNTQRWRQLRKQVLKDVPYCCNCGIGIKESPLQVHHVIPPLNNDEELFFNIDNLAVVCESCHRTITAKNILGRAKRHE